MQLAITDAPTDLKQDRALLLLPDRHEEGVQQHEACRSLSFSREGGDKSVQIRLQNKGRYIDNFGSETNHGCFSGQRRVHQAVGGAKGHGVQHHARNVLRLCHS